MKKKYIIILLLILCLCGCKNKNSTVNNTLIRKEFVASKDNLYLEKDNLYGCWNSTKNIVYDKEGNVLETNFLYETVLFKDKTLIYCIDKDNCSEVEYAVNRNNLQILNSSRRIESNLYMMIYKKKGTDMLKISAGMGDIVDEYILYYKGESCE